MTAEDDEKERIKEELRYANTVPQPKRRRKKKPSSKNKIKSSPSKQATPDYDDDGDQPTTPSRHRNEGIEAHQTPEQAKLQQYQGHGEVRGDEGGDEPTVVPIVSGNDVIPIASDDDDGLESDSGDGIDKVAIISDIENRIRASSTARNRSSGAGGSAAGGAHTVKPSTIPNPQPTKEETSDKGQRKRYLWIGLLCLILVLVVVVVLAVVLTGGDDDTSTIVSSSNSDNQEVVAIATSPPPSPSPPNDTPTTTSPTKSPTQASTRKPTSTPTMAPTPKPTFDVEVCFLADDDDDNGTDTQDCTRYEGFTDYGEVQLACPDLSPGNIFELVWENELCSYRLCCGSTTPQSTESGESLLAFCRSPSPNDDESHLIGHSFNGRTSDVDPYGNGGAWIGFSLDFSMVGDWYIRYAYTCNPVSASSDACFMAGECPIDGYTDVGFAGVLLQDDYACPFDSGVEPDWFSFNFEWCYSKLCCPS